MVQNIYGDILFLINFSMDFLSVYIAAKFMKRKIKLFSALGAAAIGGIYGVAAVILGGNMIISFIISFSVALLMCYISFGRVKLLRSTLIYYAVCFTLGGCMTALYSLFQGGVFAESGGGTTVLLGERLPLAVIVPIAAVSVIFSVIYGRVSSSGRAKSCCVVISGGGGSVSLTALTDSGNLLTEPLGGYPVILTDFGHISPVLSDELRSVFREDNPALLGELDSRGCSGVRLIPSHSAYGSKLLLGFIPEAVTVDGIPKTACVAVNRAETYNGFEALVPSVLTE